MTPIYYYGQMVIHLNDGRWKAFVEVEDDNRVHVLFADTPEEMKAAIKATLSEHKVTQPRLPMTGD